MSAESQVVRGAAFNWAALLVSVVVGFFLSPFIVHRLGNDAYGVWTFINSTIAFMGLLDLGLRGTITRFVARDQARGEHDAVRKVVSAIFWFRALLATFAVLAGFAFADILASSIEMPDALRSDARVAIVLLALSFAITFTAGVFGGVLAALRRFDLLGGSMIVRTLLRAASVIWLLNDGYGILALAILELVLVCLDAAAQRVFVYLVYREVRISLRVPGKELLREVIGFSLYAYVINICIQIIFYTDNIVVGATLSAAAVTFYAIGGGLVEYLRQVVSSLTTIFTPLASSIEATGRSEELRALLINGTRAALIIALPIAFALYARGATFIELWMGPEYAEPSSEVLFILLTAALLSIANTTSGAIVLGLGRHKIVAVWAAGEALTNLGLSIWLARSLGLAGVALGTLLPTLIIHLLLWPRFICRVVDVPLPNYLYQAWIRPLVTVIPFAFSCAWVERSSSPGSLLVFFGQIAMLLPIYAATVAIVLRQELGSQLRAPSEALPAFARTFMLRLGRAAIARGLLGKR